MPRLATFVSPVAALSALVLLVGCSVTGPDLSGTPLEAMVARSGAVAPYVVETPSETPAALRATIDAILDAAEANATDVLLQHVADDVTVDYSVDGTGHAAFVRAWRDGAGSEPRPWELFFRVFFPALRAGGAYSGQDLFTFPHHAVILRGAIEDLGRPTDDAALLVAPDIDAKGAATAGARTGICAQTLCVPEDPGSDWQTLTMPNGVVAYTPVGAMRPTLSVVRAVFQRDRSGTWKLAALVSGD